MDNMKGDACIQYWQRSRTSLASGNIKWVNPQKAQISGISGIAFNVSSTVSVSSQSPQYTETEF